MFKIYLDLFARSLLILGALGYFLMSYKKTHILVIIFGILVGLSGLYYVLDRDFYLPFLGPTVVGTDNQGVITNPKVQIKLTDLPKNKNIIYWAAGSKRGIYGDPITAYRSGVAGMTKSNSDGQATLELEIPSEYKVGTLFKMKLKRHVHFRYELDTPGLYSRVYTKYI
jgi:hypothetical protein